MGVFSKNTPTKRAFTAVRLAGEIVEKYPILTEDMVLEILAQGVALRYVHNEMAEDFTKAIDELVGVESECLKVERI